MVFSPPSVANSWILQTGCQEKGYLSLGLRRGEERTEQERKEEEREVEEEGGRGGEIEREGEGRERGKRREERRKRCRKGKGSEGGWVEVGRCGRGGEDNNLFLPTWPHQLSSHHLPTFH